MSTRQSATATRNDQTLEDQQVPVQAKLAAAWTSFMFLYAYVDILGFFTPGIVKDILDGGMFEAQSQYIVGINGPKKPFAVAVLTNPTRLVVDVITD